MTMKAPRDKLFEWVASSRGFLVMYVYALLLLLCVGLLWAHQKKEAELAQQETEMQESLSAQLSPYRNQ